MLSHVTIFEIQTFIFYVQTDFEITLYCLSKIADCVIHMLPVCIVLNSWLLEQSKDRMQFPL